MCPSGSGGNGRSAPKRNLHDYDSLIQSELLTRDCAPSTVACIVDTPGLDNCVDLVTTAIHAAASATIPLSRRLARAKKKSYWSSVAQLRMEMLTARHRSSAAPNDASLLDVWKRARTAFHRTCRHFERQIERNDMQRACQSRSQRGVWRSNASLRAGQRQLPSVIDGVSGTQDIVNLFKERFANAISEFDANAAQALPRRPSPRPIGPRPSPDVCVTLDMVTSAVGALNRGKTMGHDDLMNEHVIFGGASLHTLLVNFFQRIIALGHVPPAIRLGLM